MDLSHFSLQWLIFVLVFLRWTVVRGVNLEICETNPESIEGDGLFEVHTFEVPEGILLEPRKLIGKVTLDANDTNGYFYDEPYFKKPYSLKTQARPAHFDVVFRNVSSADNITTTPSPRLENGTTDNPKTYLTTTVANRVHSGDGAVTSSGYYLSNGTLGDLRQTVWNTVTTSLPNVTSATVTNTTAEPEIQCVVAEIYQIYDFDRETADTHYLTINPPEDNMIWGFPILVVVKVTDINDNSPVFMEESLNTRISLNTRPGSIVAELKATDADIGINAELRYSMRYNTERRGNETASPDLPTFIINEKYGVITLLSPITDMKPPTKITFSVVVKDKGDSYVSNRATASVTIEVIDDTWAPELNPSQKSMQISSGAVVGIVLGGTLLIGLIFFVVVRYRKGRVCQRDVHLEFMLDDENLINA